MKSYKVISIDEYHGDKEIPTRSALLQALKSPAHLRAYLDGKNKKTDSMKLGSFIHEYIERGLNIAEHWVVKPEVYQRTTNGRPAGSPKLDDNGNPLFSYANSYSPDDSLTAAKSVIACAMIKAIDADMFIQSALNLPDVVVEPTFVGVIDGMQVKTRPDLAFENSDTLIEIKTASSLDPADIARDMFEYGYDIQAYLELELSGAKNMYFYIISSEEPSGTARVYIDRDSPWFKIGEHRTKEALHLFYANKDTTHTSYCRGEVDVPLSYKAADYMAKNGIEA